MQYISEYGLILSLQHMSTWQMVDLVFKQYNVDYKVELEAGSWGPKEICLK